MIVVVEVEAAVDASGALETFLFSSDGWTTSPTDTPANAWVMPRLQQAANYRRGLFSGSRTFGSVQVAYGECKLANLDGGLDAFARYGFDGRRYTVRIGEMGAAYPAAFTTVLTTTMKCALFELTESSGAVRILLRDRLADLQKPLAPDLFDGGGTHGDNTGAKGIRQARVYGSIFSCQPQLINDLLQLYSVGMPRAGQGIRMGYVTDGGGFVQFDSEYPTLAALMAASVPSGYWARCPAAGAFRISTPPTFAIAGPASAIDSMGSATALAGAGTILREMALDAGLPASQISAADVTAVDLARPGPYGYRVDDEENAVDAMGKIAGGASVWFAFDAMGQLRMAPLQPPSGAAAFTFSPSNIIKLQRLDSEDSAVPIWRATARSSHNQGPQSSFGGGVVQWFRDYFTSEWPLQTAASNAATKIKHPNAGELTVDVYSGNSADRAGDYGEAARRLALFGVDRETIQVTAVLTPALLAAVDLGKTCALRFPRYGWDDGKLMLVVAITLNFDAQRVEVTLWG